MHNLLTFSGHRTTTAFDVEVFEASLEDCLSFNAILPEDPEESIDSVADILPWNVNNFLSSYCMYGYPVLPMSTLPGTWAQDLSHPAFIDKCPNSTTYDPDEDAHMLIMALPFTNPNGSSALSGSICHPKYTLRRRTVSVTSSGSTENMQLSGDIGTELKIEKPPLNLTKNFIEQTNTGFQRYQTDNETKSLSQWVLPLNWSMPQSSIENFRDANLSTQAFQQFFRTDLAQLVRGHYMSPTNQSIPSRLTSSYKRLCVGQWSLRIMEALLILTTLVAICLCFPTYPRFTRNPESLAANAALLAKSPDLWPVLYGTGESLKKPFQRSFATHQFRAGEMRDSKRGTVYTHINATGETGIAINAESETTDVEREPEAVEERRKPNWWRPMASTWPYRIAVIVLTIAVVVVLEVLYQYSVKNNGISNISINSYELNGWLYVSTIIMAGMALAYGALDSTARLLHPFQELQRGKMQFQELLYEPLGHATILATVHSLRKRYFALAVILLTSLLSPALTIVTSGLFTTTTVSYQSTEALQIQNWLLVEDGGRADCNSESRLVSDAIAFSNLSYPRWTHDDLVFPEISLNTSATNSSLSSATSLTARLPSVRSRMNCQVQGFYTAANTSVRYTDGDKTWEMTIAAPPGCVTNEAAHNETAPGTMQLGGTFTSDGTGYMGNMVTQYFINATCKNHVYLVVARIANKTFEESTVLACQPSTEVLYTTVTLTLPDLNIDTSASPPTPDERGAIRTFANYTTNRVDNCQGQEGPSTHNDTSVDPFFAAVVLGAGGVPLADLLGPANAPTLAARAQQVYGRIAAQDVHFHFRRALAAPGVRASFAFDVAGGAALSGSVTTTADRLVQSAGATRVLEALLAAMAACATVHFAVAWGARILPKDPGSVAARMSLFAGSGVVRRLVGDEGGLERAFEGEVVRLGWWEGGVGERARFGIDVGSAGRSG